MGNAEPPSHDADPEYGFFRLKEELVEKGLHHVKKYSWDKTAEGILGSCQKALGEGW